MYCSNCGAEINDKAVVCIKCGCAVNQPKTETAINQNWLITLLLCFFVGCLGVHRFYVGKTGTGIIQLITFGGCGIWTLIDFIMICIGNFTDCEGNVIKSKP